MNEPKTPNPRFWTEERCKELGKLERLLADIRELNNGSSFIERVSRCIETANELSTTDWESGTPKQHLAAFLNQCALCDRFYNNDPEKMMAERNK